LNANSCRRVGSRRINVVRINLVRCGGERGDAIAGRFQWDCRSMSVDEGTVRRIARLARIAVRDADVPHLQGELNAILSFVEQLNEVDVAGVEPMTSVTPLAMKKRQDLVTDGGYPERIVRNAPATDDHYFLVPKVVE
jgi:aspartyl-tRNA(Asn)/glutamyl-tRNA(Gln) amidotransferase subunit C